MLFAHNDSGDESRIYVCDTTTADIRFDRLLTDVQHMDWEDICTDQAYLYIGDFGNNSGNRTNLVIHKISLQAIAQPFDTVRVDSQMHFTFQDQTSFEPSSRHNFDCEAMIEINDELVLFSKSRINDYSKIYRLPKSFNNLSIAPHDSLLLNGWVTAGDRHRNRPYCVLVVAEATSFSPGCQWRNQLEILRIEGNAIVKYKSIKLDNCEQIEGICHLRDDVFLLGSEREVKDQGRLLKIDLAAFF